MALKNTYTKLPAGRHIQMAQDALVKAGASGISTVFEEGRIIGIAFTIEIKGTTIQFKLPVNWRNFQNVLRKEDNRRADEDDYAYRVAWACTADWIEAQMAFIESENVTLTQVFLPYAVTKNGDTLFEHIAKNPQNLLGSGE
jgi:hypothetical protein